MARRVGFHPLARSDLEDLYDYIHDQSGPERAANYLDRIEQLCISLGEYTERARARNDITPGLRTMTMGRRLLVAFMTTSETVTILRVLYAGRDLRGEEIPSS